VHSKIQFLEQIIITVIPRLTSDPANEISAYEDFFRCFSNSANEYGFG